ncbi:hypothetical protein LNP26_23280 [Klebsiella variicola subsp. variicola]|nr:hypothetical protein [Klebsiella variicola subsp. variicola]
MLNPRSPDEYQTDARFYPADRGRPHHLSLLLRGGEVYVSHQLVCPGRARRVLPGPGHRAVSARRSRCRD